MNSLRISQLVIWKEKVLTLNGAPYYLADGGPCDSRDVNIVFNHGSKWYYADNKNNIFCASKGSGGDSDKANVAFRFNSPQVITKVV